MTDRDTEDMLVRVISEIQILRAENDKLRPKANAYDRLSQVLDLLPKQSQGFAPDIVWQLQNELDTLRSPKKEAE